ncbi:MAG: winged helix-turn-helix transcriptional regulator [Nanobdellota archaeon]
MNEKCTIYRTLDIIGKKWSLLIILSIYKNKNNKKQFNSIKKDLHSITSKILSKRLKELEYEEILKKEIDSSKIPINTYYSLTDSGKKLIKIIQDIKKWGIEYKFNNKECKGTFCKNCNF